MRISVLSGGHLTLQFEEGPLKYLPFLQNGSKLSRRVFEVEVRAVIKSNRHGI